MPDILIAQPDTAGVESEALTLLGKAQALTITDRGSHAVVLETIAESRRRRKFVEDLLAESIGAAHQAHKSLTSLRARLTKPYLEIEECLGRLDSTWVLQQRRIADEAARQATERARRAEEERRLAEAQAAQDSGQPELAEAILEQPVVAVVAHVEPDVAVIAGVSARQAPWSAEVQDLRALARHVADTGQTTLILPAMPALNQQARSLKGALSIPGVRAVQGQIGRQVRNVNTEEDVPW